ncbi:MAG: chloride channel protein, partial [Actinomycetota bacterium]
TFNAPLAGVFFAMELILVNFEVRSFGMIVLSSVTASVVGRAAMGSAPFLTLPNFTVDHLWEYALFAVLGLLGGVAGVIFTRVLYAIEDVCDRVWHGPEWLRPATGGVLLGLLLLVLPQMYGVGYPVLAAGIAGKYTIVFLLVLLVAKMFATSLTIGIGGSGGVFAPSLFIGAMLGSAFGEIMHIVAPGIAGPVGAYGLIGMGAVFAGAARAPITAVVIMFELTGEYTIILPLMSAIVLATFISQRIAPRDTIYTLKLRRRGVDLSSKAQSSPRADAIPVSAVMLRVPTSLRASDSLMKAARALARSPQGVLPVVDADGAYCGTVSAHSVVEALADGEHDATHVGDVTDLPPALRSVDLLDFALQILDDAGGAVPVLDAEGHEVVGWLTHRSALNALRSAVAPAPAGGGPRDA